MPHFRSLPVTDVAAARELSCLDAEVARHEGPGTAVFDTNGTPFSPDGSRYSPTSDATETIRLMNKYVRRLARLGHAWIAIGRNGRAEEGATAMIATCKVVMNSVPGPA